MLLECRFVVVVVKGAGVLLCRRDGGEVVVCLPSKERRSKNLDNRWCKVVGNNQCIAFSCPGTTKVSTIIQVTLTVMVMYPMQVQWMPLNTNTVNVIKCFIWSLWKVQLTDDYLIKNHRSSFVLLSSFGKCDLKSSSPSNHIKRFSL